MIYYVVNFDFELQTSLKFCLVKFRICVFYLLVMFSQSNETELRFWFISCVYNWMGLIYLNFGGTLSKQNLNVKI